MLKKMQGGSDILAPPPDDELDNDHLTDNDELDTVRGKSHLNPFDLVSTHTFSMCAANVENMGLTAQPAESL